MLTRLTFVAFALLPNFGLAATGIYGSIKLAEANVANLDPTTLLPAAPVDVYHVSLCNCNPLPVRSLQLGFESNFVNNNGDFGITFKETADLPALGPFVVADSFFVVNEDPSLVLAVANYTVDDGDMLQAAYTLAGPANLIPSMAERVVAVLSVPAGSSALDSSIVRGALTDIDGQFLDSVVFRLDNNTPCSIPEPTTCVLAGLALVGAAGRRRV
jgi:hypothetical protein